MNSISQTFETHTTRSLRIYRWVTAWLVTSAVIALLLLANSIRDYRFVSRFIATDQVRHLMSQRATALEHELQQNPLSRDSSFNALLEPGDEPVWNELRTADGAVLNHAGAASKRLFSEEDELSHLGNNEPLFTVVPTSAGDTVVEVFMIHARLTPPQQTPATLPALAQHGPPRPLFLEMAVPLTRVNGTIVWPILRNLFINCAGALALLVTVMVAGAGFRSYAHGKYLDEQLEIARQVQSELLPSLTQLYPGIELATEYTPAEQVGGDFYDIFRVRDRGIALVMGDVAGKGVPAALLMGVIHGAVRSSLWSESPSRHQLESQQLNRLLCEGASGERYASMFWCYHDAATNSLGYVNAGHCPPLLVRRNSGEVKIIRLDIGGPVFGVLSEARYENGTLELSTGDILVMYSDGLVEATNGRGEEYGEGRLRELLTTVSEKTVTEIRRAILTSLAGFSASARLRDDLTFVVAQFTPAGSSKDRPVTIGVP